MAYLRVENLEKSFNEQKVLDYINIEIEKESFITILGHSGCGKSTLLRCIAGLETFDNGAIYLNDERLDLLKPNKRNIGMIFQQYSLFPTKSVYDNIAFGLKIKNMSNEMINDKVMNILKKVDLVGYDNKYPMQLSGGEQQRVALARSLVIEPKIMLYDEPLSAIDAQLRKDLQHSLRNIHNELKMTSIFVTHDQEEAMILSDIIYVMNNGVIEQYGTPDELYHNPKNYFVASFIGDHNIINKSDAKNMLSYKTSYDYVVISPENIKINENINNSISLNGKVIDILSLGSYTKVMIDCDGLLLKCNTTTDIIKNININEILNISIDVKKIFEINH